MTKKIDLTGWYFERIYRYRNRCNILFFNFLVHLVCRIKGVKTGKNVRFNGFPLIRRYEHSSIRIGDNCLFNSSRHSVRVGLQKPCVFVTLSEGAEIVVGNNSGGSGSTLMAARKITVGNNVLIGANTMIIDNDFHNPDPARRLESENVPSRPITIEDNVFIGANCMVLKGITIGENSVIGANSVIVSNIPKNAIAIGNPCKVVIIKNWNIKNKQVST